MAWNDIIEKVDEILQSECGLTPAPELFNVKMLPETMMNKSYSVWPESLEPNTALATSGDQTFPVSRFRISIAFDLENNDVGKRDAVATMVEDVYKRIIHPSNRSTNTRIVKFIGSTTEMLTESGFWAVAELIFTAEYMLTYTPT